MYNMFSAALSTSLVATFILSCAFPTMPENNKIATAGDSANFFNSNSLLISTELECFFFLLPNVLPIRRDPEKERPLAKVWPFIKFPIQL